MVKGRLRSRQPKLKPNQAKHLLELHDLGTYSQAVLADLFAVGRSTIYRTIERKQPKPIEPERPFAQIAVPRGPPTPKPALCGAVELLRRGICRPTSFR